LRQEYRRHYSIITISSDIVLSSSYELSFEDVWNKEMRGRRCMTCSPVPDARSSRYALFRLLLKDSFPLTYK